MAELPMRALLDDTHSSARKRLSLLLAALLLAALCVLVAGDDRAPANVLREKYEKAQGQLEDVRESRASLAQTLAEQNTAIDSMIGEVSKLRQRQAAVEAELAEKQAALDRATAALEKERAHLREVRAQLQRAMRVLSDRLVAIYESGNPDVVAAIVESSSWSDLASQTEYLNRIQRYDDAVVERVRDLRDEVEGAVARLADARAEIKQARDAIASIEREVAATRAAAEARFAELKEAQHRRRAQMEELESREEALSSNLASISSQMATSGQTAPASAPPPLTPGQTAQYISPNQAAAPASAPAAVKAVIAAANAIASTPYIWGGGHGSFDSPGYDCSGAVSYALHGGGMLSSPLDSTGLSTWGEPGAGQWISVYANSGHAWMIIAGLAFDTSGSGGSGPRWHSSPPNSPSGFIVRHPSGY